MTDAAAKKDAPISASAVVSRVSTKFAYLTSNSYGGIFVPPSAALPPDSSDADLSKHLRTGDVVHFSAVRQRGRIKNDCAYVATRVSLSSHNAHYQAPPLESAALPSASQVVNGDEALVTDQLGCVDRVNDTFCYLWSDRLQLVFCPGSAYEPLPHERPRLTTVLQTGDVVVFSARPQTERNGCHWLALSVAPTGRATSDASSAPAAVDRRRLVANVQMVAPMFVIALSEAVGCVHCPILAWLGSAADRAAETLADVLVVGQRVLVEAEQQDARWGCSWRAVRFWPSDAPPAADLLPLATAGESAATPADALEFSTRTRIVRKSVSESFAQTNVTGDQLLANALRRRRDLYESVRQHCPFALDYAEML